LFPRFRPKERDHNTYQCKDCGAIFKARIHMVAFNGSTHRFFTLADRVEVKIPCPSCGRETGVHSFLVCKCICPNCSKECFVAKSQTGQSVRHTTVGCMKEFIATPSEPTIMEQKIRLMRYAEQASSQPSGSAPPKTQMQVLQQDDRPTKEQINSLTGGMKLDPRAKISASKLEPVPKTGKSASESIWVSECSAGIR